MNISEIKKGIFFEGRNTGIPCIFVNFLNAENNTSQDLNEVLTNILAFNKVKTVAIFGNLSEEPEIKSLMVGLVSKGKKILFNTSATEDIGPVRQIQRTSFILQMAPPTKQENTIKITNLALLKENDELKISISNMTDYENAKKFIKSRNIVMPTILFSINLIEDTEEITAKYLADSDSFHFYSKLSKAIFL